MYTYYMMLKFYKKKKSGEISYASSKITYTKITTYNNNQDNRFE